MIFSGYYIQLRYITPEKSEGSMEKAVWSKRLSLKAGKMGLLAISWDLSKPYCYYGLNVCIPLKLTHWRTNPQCDGIGGGPLWEVIGFRWGHEGGVSRMGLVSLKEKHQRVCFLSLPAHTEESTHEDTARRQVSATQGERSTRHQPCWHLDLGLLVPRIVRNKLLLKPPTPLYFVIAALAD